MPFILLGRADDGQLTLLSTTAWPKRSDALAELSRITGEPGFDRWDDEVFVFDIDIDSGTPVLLVRPASAPVAADESGESADEPDETAAETDEIVAESTQVTVQPDEAAIEPDQTADESPEIVALLDDLSAEEAGGTKEDTDEVGESPEAGDSLKDALSRTAARLEAEGIVAPESIGPAEEGDAEVAEADRSDDESAGAPAPAPGAWPWDSGTEPPKRAFDLDAVEMPRDEGESLVRAPGDDETMSVSRPVILGGEYDTGNTDDAPPTPVDPAAPVPEEAGVESDFIELGVSEPQVAMPDGSAVPSDAAPQTDIRTLVCDECVYEQSCPNKGQLDPATCGSFQWK